MTPQTSPAGLDADIPCMTCAYNLRTLLPTGRCPECGTIVGDSLIHFQKSKGSFFGRLALGAAFLAAYGLLSAPLIPLGDGDFFPIDQDTADAINILTPLLAVLIVPGLFLVAFTTPAQRRRRRWVWICGTAAVLLLLIRGAMAYMQFRELGSPLAAWGGGPWIYYQISIYACQTAAELLQLFLIMAALVALRKFALVMCRPWLVPLTTACLGLCAAASIHAAFTGLVGIASARSALGPWWGSSLPYMWHFVLERTTRGFTIVQLAVDILFWALVAILARRAMRET